MAEFLCVFNLHLLFSVISLSLLQIISADLLSVDPGQNITLLCNITNYSEISWYHMNSAGVRKLISARQGTLDKDFYVDYNEDKSHFYLTQSSSSVSLVIIGVRETDLGFYYCGGRNDAAHTEFGKPIILNFTGSSDNERDSSSEDSDSHQTAGDENIWIKNLMCVCSISVLIIIIIIIILCVFCIRVQGKSASSCCSHTSNSTEKNLNRHPFKPVVRTVKRWTSETEQDLQACFECTDWSIFEAGATDLDELTETVTSYISFCEDMCIPTRTYLSFNNDKPWFTAKLRHLRQAKEDAFRNGDRVLYNQARNTLNKEIRVAKRSYAKKLENQFSSNDPASVWKGLKYITNYKTPSPSTEANQQLAEDLNEFYCRFETAGLTPHAPSEHLSIQPLTPPATPLSPPPALRISEDDVRQIFLKQKRRKAPGPDGVTPACLKTCADQLAFIFSQIFNRSLELCEVPACFKHSTIIPIPKKPKITGLNDYRPVALTSVVMKSFERLVLAYLKNITGPLLDPLQFAYRANRSVDDAVNMGLHFILQHLEKSGTYLLKFADDTTLIGLIQDGDESAYRQGIEQLAAWCSRNNLELNTLKTVEMIVDFRRNTPALPSLTIMNSTVPTVESFRFLGTTISQDLKWDTHIDATIKKAQQRLYFLRQLRKFNLPQELLTHFYSAVIESVLCTSITVWFGSATKSDMRRLQRTVRTAERIIGAPLPTLQELYTSRVRKRALKITLDPSHPGHILFDLLPSGRRYRAANTRTARHKNSFFPRAIYLLNS
ncbi:hypothetical protein QTP86_028030 [Hemibagrus guttatus]|nr:hypothetical protein QTP86_028030 [Hemibagrus guttatus]